MVPNLAESNPPSLPTIWWVGGENVYRGGGPLPFYRLDSKKRMIDLTTFLCPHPRGPLPFYRPLSSHCTGNPPDSLCTTAMLKPARISNRIRNARPYFIFFMLRLESGRCSQWGGPFFPPQAPGCDCPAHIIVGERKILYVTFPTIL